MSEHEVCPNEEIPASVRAAELREQVARLRRAKELKENNGILFYTPHAKQDKFHSLGDHTGRYCRTGNRGGKTKCGAAEDVAWLLGGRTWYTRAFDVTGVRKNPTTGVRETIVVRHHPGGKDHELVRKGIPQRPVKGLLLVNDWDKAKEIFTNRTGTYETYGELFQLIPRDAIAGVHTSRGGHIDQIRIKRPKEFGGGESILFIDTVESWKHAKLSAESSDWDFIHLDEPCPLPMFTGHKRGLVDRNGKFWINCTPLDEMWINDEFTPPGQNSVKDASQGLSFSKLANNKGLRFIITWSIWDNPYNSDDAIAEFEAGLNREERACRLNGLPLAMAGMVYKEFIYDLHVLCDVPKGWEDYHLPPKTYTIRWWFDYHLRLPQAVLFLATDPKGRIFVYDELFEDNLIGPVAEAVKTKTERYFVADTEIDPYALIDHPVTGENIADELMKYDLYVTPATKDRALGINKVREKLLERDEFGQPTIFFSPRLAETLWEFTHYVFDTKKNVPKDENDHMMENLYRAILNGLSYIEPVTQADYSYRRSSTKVQPNEDRNQSFSKLTYR